MYYVYDVRIFTHVFLNFLTMHNDKLEYPKFRTIFFSAYFTTKQIKVQVISQATPRYFIIPFVRFIYAGIGKLIMTASYSAHSREKDKYIFNKCKLSMYF